LGDGSCKDNKIIAQIRLWLGLGIQQLYHMWKREKFHESDMREFLSNITPTLFTKRRNWRSMKLVPKILFLLSCDFHKKVAGFFLFLLRYQKAGPGRNGFKWCGPKTQHFRSGKEEFKSFPFEVKILSSCTPRILL
jgi:hypothetical protein